MLSIFRNNKIAKIGILLCITAMVSLFLFLPFSVWDKNIVSNAVHAQTTNTPIPELQGDSDTAWVSADIWQTPVAWVANGMLTLTGVSTWMGGVLLNYATGVTVVGMGDSLKEMPALLEAWTILRDLGNIIIIFSLLIIGIATILRISSYSYKTLLVNLIIVALLLNFSLFFTKFVIDIGNILSYQFYHKIVDKVPNCQSQEAYGGCLSDSFIDKLKITTIYNVDNGLGGLASTNNPSATILEGRLSVSQIFISGVMGSIFLVITAFVFFAAAILLLIRFAVLILLMILSPLAFVGWILPYTRKYMTEWWNMLFSQTFFAPLLFLMFYISMLLIDGIQRTVIPSDGAGFGALFHGERENVAVIINFIIIIIFMIASLVVAKKIGAVGAETVIKWGQNARRWSQGFAGRNLVARPFRKLDNMLGRTRLGSSYFGHTIRRGTTGAIVNSKFGSTENLKQADEAYEKDLDRTRDQLKNNPVALARFIQKTKGRKYVYGKLSASDRAAIDPHISSGLRTTLLGDLTPEEQEKTRKATREAQTGKVNTDLRNSIKNYAISGGTTVTPVTTSDGRSYATIDDIVEALPPKEARRLSTEARKNPDIIRRLSTRHLDDLMREGDLTSDEVRTITNEILHGSRYPNQTAHLAYITNPNRRALWNV
ncbi:MAG TPA: hypothetical protein VJH21_01775 [Candidatus Paceibacterota bacterium]